MMQISWLLWHRNYFKGVKITVPLAAPLLPSTMDVQASHVNRQLSTLWTAYAS
jgi:hypothetical protein